MPVRIPIPKRRLIELEEFREAKWTAMEFKHYLCVWLRAGSGMTADAIAAAVGMHPDSVRRVQRDFIARGKEALGGAWGGRHRQAMTLGEEGEFLKGFLGAARDASLLTIGEIKAALEKSLGREVHRTTVYRMLKRHGWRKLAPRPRHPGQDKEAVEAFKKRAMRKPSGKPGRKPKKPAGR